MSKSIEELIKLAESNRTAYMIELGLLYLSGRDLSGKQYPKNYLEARKWLEKAHADGATFASYLLGTMYEEGNGVTRNIDKAIELYEIASQRGGYMPHLHLARIYAKGDGVDKSVELAKKWYRDILSFGDNVKPEIYDEASTYIADSKK
jgi:TPR repeat protein